MDIIYLLALRMCVQSHGPDTAQRRVDRLCACMQPRAPPTLDPMPIDPLLLKQIALLRDFPDAALTGLAGSAMERKLVRREVVLNKGYQLQFFPFLLDGRLQGI